MRFKDITRQLSVCQCQTIINLLTLNIIFTDFRHIFIISQNILFSKRGAPPAGGSGAERARKSPVPEHKKKYRRKLVFFIFLS